LASARVHIAACDKLPPAMLNHSRPTPDPATEILFNEARERVSASRLRFGAIAIVMVVGLFRAFVGRYSMNPDGMCYLDMGDAFFHRRWLDVVNGYWSPLYAWLLGAGLFLTKPSRWWEFPVAHAVNFLIYLAAIGCFEFFRRALAADMRKAGSGSQSHVLSEQSLITLSYALFLWTSLELITIWDISPDLCVAALVYLIAGLLLRLRNRATPQLFIALGAALGLAYLTKAVMFPLGVAFILIGFACVPRHKKLSYVLLVPFVFLSVSAPWLVALSQAKGRFDFGDSGRLNYSALVSPGGRLLNWQGQPPGSGIPVHTTRTIHENPPVYEFATPIGGTYPPSYDPSYWNEGRKWTFDARTQFTVIKDHLLMYAELLLRDQSGLLAGVLTLIIVGGAATRKSITDKWFLFAMCIAAMGLYTPVHVEPRFVGAYISILWMTILFSVRLSSQEQGRMAEYLSLAVMVTVLLSVADGTVAGWPSIFPLR